MATLTPNYGLTKPAYDESADIDVINGNMDILDTSLHSEVETLSSAITTETTTARPIATGGTGATTAAAARTNLGFLEGINSLAYKRTTISSQGSKTFTFTETGSFMFVLTQASNSCCGGVVIRGVKNGTCYHGTFGSVSNINVTKTSGKVTLANSASASVFVDMIALDGAEFPTY